MPQNYYHKYAYGYGRFVRTLLPSANVCEYLCIRRNANPGQSSVTCTSTYSTTIKNINDNENHNNNDININNNKNSKGKKHTQK